LEGVAGQRAEAVATDPARVVAGSLRPAIREPALRLWLSSAEDPCEHVDPSRHVPDGLADVVAALIGAPLEGVVVDAGEPPANACANVLEPFRHQLGVAHRCESMVWRCPTSGAVRCA